MQYTPSRMDFLVTELQAALRQDNLLADRYLLDTSPNSETVRIYVRYLPDVNRAAMNVSLDAARRVIRTVVSGHGWTSWVRVEEDVRQATP
jgi:hypothetical protein